MTAYQDMGPNEPRGWSPFAVAMIATLVLLLGLGGALFGIYVANVNAAAASSTATPTTSTISPTIVRSATSTPTTPAVTSTPPVTPTVAPGSFPLPKLTGLDFEVARGKVRQLDLDWTLAFADSGHDKSVASTEPTAGTLVHKGVIVHITVKGQAPPANVPTITGKPCADAAAAVIDAGLFPEFLSDSRTGPASAPEQHDLHWNDVMQLACGG